MAGNTKRTATRVEYQHQALEPYVWTSSVGVLRQDALRLVLRIVKNVRMYVSVYVRGARAYSRVFTFRVASGLPRAQ